MLVIVDIKRLESDCFKKCNENVTFEKISRTFPQIETTSFLMLTLFRHHYFFAQISACICLTLLKGLSVPYLKATGCNVLIDSKDVAMMMILLKVARAAVPGIHLDNYVDIAGYAACAYGNDGMLKGDD